MPATDDIYALLHKLFTAAALNPECAIVSLVYVNRLVAYTHLALHASNWKRIVLGAVLMASKVWDDQAGARTAVFALFVVLCVFCGFTVVVFLLFCCVAGEIIVYARALFLLKLPSFGSLERRLLHHPSAHRRRRHVRFFFG